MIEMYNGSVSMHGKLLFKGVTFQATAGDKVAVTGNEGCGKTVLMHAMLGLTPMSIGWVCVDGEPVLPDTAQMFRNRMSYMPSGEGLESVLVGELMEGVFALRANSDCIYTKEAVFKEWDKLDIAHDCYTKTFGETDAATAQRIRLALTGLAGRPYALIDDPLSLQDANGRTAVLTYLCSPVFSQSAIIVATRDNELLSVCNKTINLNDY